MKFLSKLSPRFLDSKTCLVRFDLNIQDNELKNSLRLQRAIPTILFLLEKGCKVIIVSHRGRPDNNSKFKNQKSKFSLKNVGRSLSQLIGQRVHFVDDFDFENIRKGISKHPQGTVFLLENLRFLAGEDKNDRGLAKKLASLGNIYINDAFAVSHRANASVVAIAKFLPSYAGLGLESELKAFKKVMKCPAKPLVVILGGAKVSDKVGVIKAFARDANKILVGGGVANTFFAAKNIPVGGSLYDRDSVGIVKKWVSSDKIELPDDVIMKEGKIYDIGPHSVKHFSELISKARTVIWNGPMGYIESKNYQKGTLELVRAIGRSRTFSVVGGGETTSLILRNGLEKNASFLSAGGGAMLEYLAGKNLPGIKALEKK